MKKNFTVVILVVLLIVVSVAFAYYYGKQQSGLGGSITPEIDNVTKNPTPSSLPSVSPTTSPVSDIPSGWITYKNEVYSFEISYPASYKALTDQNNLYGWPNAIVLIYEGGQSYDLVIEHWNTQLEYENKYKNQTNITVKKIGNYYITLFNTNFDAEVDNIIDTFKSLE